MAATKNKKTTKQTKKPTGGTKTARKTPKTTVPEEPISGESNFSRYFPYFLIAFAVFIVLSFFLDAGKVGGAVVSILPGLFGSAVYAIPVLMIAAGIQWRRRKNQGKLGTMIISLILFFVFLSILLHRWTGGLLTENKGSLKAHELVKALWADGQAYKGAGAVGGLIALLFDTLFKKVSALFGILGVLIFAPLCVGITPYAIYIRIAYAIKHAKAEKKEARELSQEEIYQKEVAKQQEKYSQRVSDIRKTEKESSRVIRDVNDKHRFTPDIDIGEKGYAEEDDSSKLSQITVDDYEDEPEEKSETSEVIDRLVDDFRKNGDDDGDEPPFDISVGTTFSGKQVKRKSDMPLSSGIGAVYAEPIKEPVKKAPAPSVNVHSPSAAVPSTSIPAPETDAGNDSGQLISDSELAMLNNFAKAQQENEAKKNDMMAGKEGAEYMPQDEEEDVQPVKKAYVFPPLSLLKYDLTPKNVDISDELSTNANKLVETLKSFKVETRLINVSRGPAITRYELQPKEGVRVKQIANLVDDIALNLATTGVRIEAPIPGKAAVGVEVPNKTISTVYLRELVDTETFSKAASKLNVCLGVDVAGEPVYLDIAKMPHLLIAGATGMGKSVCINSLITSILYKSSPDDVKMILIDPKKVEFDIYSGLPHLLVPVVSDPKQAAGALQWAVTEMERRFDLIGSVGVRDVKTYNQVTADDYDKEHLCSIVIIIDELADLMMTAPDDVEASICRLAQKARAAGMHIIIGTQRPSVDVITGLIKANVPSRIAFTVASQTDSRVVLDMAGAEKLIGRGDMLYAPVGSPKPRRVQGAYVSESETEAIVNFIKENNVETEYDSSVTEAIERNAAACGNKKGSAAGVSAPETDGGEGDPMLRQAIELAIESGKISTSLIQRRLSLGYGRAAKLIDEMEKMGIVSAPEGQKPRNVLISKSQYMEMFVSRGDELGLSDN